MTRIYKLLDRLAWERAQAEGTFRGSSVDMRDGFIHFSDAAQAQETARLHFTNAQNLLLLTIDAGALGEALRWEASRGGAMFPHLHGVLPTSAVIAVRDLALAQDGVPVVGMLEA